MRRALITRFLLGIYLTSSLQHCVFATQSTPLAIDPASSVRMAMEHNPSIRLGRTSMAIAREEIKVEEGAFEPSVSVTIAQIRDDDLGTDTGEGSTAEIRIQGTSPTGTSYSTWLRSDHFDNVQSGHEVQSEIGVEIRQKLLRGFGLATNMVPIRAAAKNARMTREAFANQTSELVTRVQYAYLDVILAERQAEVARSSLVLTQSLYEQNRRRADLHAIASSDLFQAQYEMASREDTLYQAERALAEARNSFRLLVTSDPVESVTMAFELEKLPAAKELTIDALKDFKNALELRPDYRQAVVGLEISQIEKLRASNNLLPDLDFFISASFSDNASNTARASHEALRDEKPEYYAGLSLTSSLTKRSERALFRIASQREDTMRISLSQLEQLIAVQLDNAARSITLGWKRLQVARKSSLLAKKSLQAEQKRFDAGTSSTFILLNMQTDLMQAQLRELAAENDYRKSIVDYRRLSGRTLSDFNIVID